MAAAEPAGQLGTGSPAAPPERPVPDGGQAGRRGALGPSGVGDPEDPPGEEYGAHGWVRTAEPGRTPAWHHLKEMPLGQLLFQVFLLLWKLKGLRHQPVSLGARRKDLLLVWTRENLSTLSCSPQANLKNKADQQNRIPTKALI